jgi:phage baseplate assembly protein W
MTMRDDPFLGTGWSFPPTFDASSASVRMVSAERDIRESLWILLSTEKGERVMVPEYGCDIWRYVFRGITTTLIAQVERAVATAILNWEPRVTVIEVTASQNPDAPGTLFILIDYEIRRINTRSNMVYPFYLEEATIPPLIA